MKTTLDKLTVGTTGLIKKINTDTTIKRRLLDLGLIKGTKVKYLYKSPLGDPTAYLIRGSVIALRKKDAMKIEILTEGDGI